MDMKTWQQMADEAKEMAKRLAIQGKTKYGLSEKAADYHEAAEHNRRLAVIYQRMADEQMDPLF